MTAQTILPANTLSGGFEVANSCMFDGTSAYLSKTQGSGNRQIFTLSTWFKTCVTGADQTFYGSFVNSSGYDYIFLNSSDQMNVNFRASGSNTAYVTTNRLFRDTSAWYHLVVAVDTTQATAANRIKIYINGVQETSFATASYPNEDTNTTFNNGGTGYVGSVDSSQQYFNGYLAEVVWLDGQALGPTSFGEFDEDSGIWKPINVSGLTFGTSGFYLDFQDSANLGNDASGGTDFGETNIAATDQATDTCTNNFATFNPLASVTDAPTFSEGNLQIAISNAGRFGAASTIGMTSGKWYCEMKLVATSDDDGGVGIISDFDDARQDLPVGESANTYGYKEKTGNKINANNEVSYGDAYNSAGDILGIALDLDNLKIYFSKNGTFQNSGDPTSGATGTGAAYTVTAPASTVAGAYFFVGSCFSGSQSNTFAANFGSPAFAISSGNADANGHGNFEYAPPSGYFALCTKNLAEFG